MAKRSQIKVLRPWVRLSATGTSVLIGFAIYRGFTPQKVHRVQFDLKKLDQLCW